MFDLNLKLLKANCVAVWQEFNCLFHFLDDTPTIGKSPKIKRGY